MKVEHSVTKVGKLQKIEVLLKDDKDNLTDGEISIIIKAPDGLETIYLPADTFEEADKGIYTHRKGVSDTFVSKAEKGKYQVTFSPESNAEHECIVVLMGDRKIDDYRFKFKP
ncbi:MAG: hypothetical protein JW716_02550 [Candidatus Aenigmarchaeota archaeon]|nr:hypothetical protein [Candidatus Aenigmarchaeota archaeon]